MSSSELEFMAVTSTTCQGIWLQIILEDMKKKQGATTIYFDNQSTIAMTKNSAYPFQY